MDDTILKKNFEDNGFVICKNLIDVCEFAKLKDALQNEIKILINNHNPSVAMMSLQQMGLWKKHEELRRFISKDVIIQLSKRLLDTEVVKVWDDQLIIKPAFNGKESPWHRDYPYWPMEKPSAITCWIPLCDVEENNGCLRFLCGSHKWEHESTILPLTEEYLCAMEKNIDFKSILHLCPIGLGDFTFHNGMVYHGASANYSPIHRIAYKIVFMSGETVYRSQSHYLTQNMNFIEGKIIEGDNFPEIDNLKMERM